MAIAIKDLAGWIKISRCAEARHRDAWRGNAAVHKEGQAWKLADQTLWSRPRPIKACHDEPAENETAYNTNANSNVGGQIRRVEFKPDHTLVVIRVVDEENCLILPPRDWLVQHNSPPDKFVAWAMIEIDGSPHRSDKQRVLGGKMDCHG